MIKEQKLQKWGSSYAVRIPKNMVDKLGLAQNDILAIQDTKSTLVIKKINPVITGKDIINACNKSPLKCDDGHNEVDFSRDASLARDTKL